MMLFLLFFFINTMVYAKPSDGTVEIASMATNHQSMTIKTGVIGKGTLYETVWSEMLGKEEGASIIIEAGIHGDEIAGTLAIEALLPEIEILKGRVIWLPQMNKPAYQIQKRFINIDLNKVFPGDKSKKEYEHALAAELFQWVGSHNVDVVLTLHESRYLHDGTNPKTFGQTIVYGVKPIPKLLNSVLHELNQRLDEPRHKFYSNYFPIATSSTEQFVSHFGLEGFCAETWRGFELEKRILLQRKIILSFLKQMGIEYKINTFVK